MRSARYGTKLMQVPPWLFTVELFTGGNKSLKRRSCRRFCCVSRRE